MPADRSILDDRRAADAEDAGKVIQRRTALEPGDAMDQPTFHRRYEGMPPHIKAELIGGVVYMPAPIKAEHAQVHSDVNGWLFLYKTKTPGVYASDNATHILGPDSEPQPDAALRVISGQTRLRPMVTSRALPNSSPR